MISPLAVVECKAPDIMIGDDAIKQAMDYADILNAEYIFTTNGQDALAAKYDWDAKSYVDLKELPDYKSMLCGKGDILPKFEPKKRFVFKDLQKNQDYYCEYCFGYETPVEYRPFLTNLWECLMDVEHKMPEGEYRTFTLIQDYGIRYLSCGNASGGKYQGEYRSFLIKHKRSTKFVNLSFFEFGPDTIFTVSIDKIENKPHNSLQYSLRHIVKNGAEYKFFHNGQIAIANIGSGKSSQLKKLMLKEIPWLIVDDKIYLGSLRNTGLLYLDQPDMISFVENMIGYALVRDMYRRQKINYKKITSKIKRKIR